MAIGAGVIHVNSGAAATSFTSAAFTPAADALLVAWMGARTSAAAIPTASDSLGGTWTLVPGTNLSAGAGGIKCSLYYQRVSSSPASMTVTVTSSGAIGCSLLVMAYTGSGTDTSNVGINTNTAGDPAPTLPSGAGAATSTGLCFGVFNAGAAPTTTPSAAGYSSVVNSVPATNLRHTLFVDTSSPAANPTWVSTATDSASVVWELKEAAAAFTGTVAQTTTIAAQAASGTAIVKATAFQASAFQASPAFQIVAVAVTGTIAQTLSIASQAASGTNTAAAAVTGTVVQTLSVAQQSATGTVTAAAAVSGTIVQTLSIASQGASGTVTAAAAVTGTIVQGPSVAQQSAIGIVAVAGAITGLIIQTAPVAAQSATGTVTAAAAVSGTIVQSAPSAQQTASGTVAAVGAIVGTIAQTAPSAQQAALGAVTGGVVPDTRPVGGFAGWSEEAEEARRKYQRRKRRAEIELRELIEATARGEEYPPTPVIEAVAALADMAADSLLPPPELGDLRAQVALLEMTLRRVLEEENLRQMIAAQRLIEEEAMITLLLVA